MPFSPRSIGLNFQRMDEIRTNSAEARRQLQELLAVSSDDTDSDESDQTVSVEHDDHDTVIARLRLKGKTLVKKKHKPLKLLMIDVMALIQNQRLMI